MYRHFRSKSMDGSEIKIKQKPDFILINKLECGIISLKNQLKSTSSMDELTVITDKIIQLERSVAKERLSGYQNLNKKRLYLEDVLDGINTVNNINSSSYEHYDKAAKQIQYELGRVTMLLKHKIDTYKVVLDKKIVSLQYDYDELQKNIDLKATL